MLTLCNLFLENSRGDRFTLIVPKTHIKIEKFDFFQVEAFRKILAKNDVPAAPNFRKLQGTSHGIAIGRSSRVRKTFSSTVPEAQWLFI